MEEKSKETHQLSCVPGPANPRLRSTRLPHIGAADVGTGSSVVTVILQQLICPADSISDAISVHGAFRCLQKDKGAKVRSLPSASRLFTPAEELAPKQQSSSAAIISQLQFRLRTFSAHVTHVFEFGGIWQGAWHCAAALYRAREVPFRLLPQVGAPAGLWASAQERKQQHLKSTIVFCGSNEAITHLHISTYERCEGMRGCNRCMHPGSRRRPCRSLQQQSSQTSMYQF